MQRIILLAAVLIGILGAHNEARACKGVTLSLCSGTYELPENPRFVVDTREVVAVPAGSIVEPIDEHHASVTIAMQPGEMLVARLGGFRLGSASPRCPEKHQVVSDWTPPISRIELRTARLESE